MVAWISFLCTISTSLLVSPVVKGHLFAVCSHQTIKKDEFYALLSAADLGVITPLRDGMNTTSMEFVIAQGKTKRSPLILSEFMGISSNMIEALQINPWNLDVRLLILCLITHLLTHRLRPGCSSGYAPWPAYDSGRKGHAAC
jgi:Glycosyltransferase family 20